MAQNALRVRRSLREIENDYTTGKDKTALEKLMRAWKGIKELPHEDPRSFFKLGGFHGEPFRGEGATNAAFWGGYCQHGNVLFPSWHRVYCYKVEEALRSIKGCEDVTLPYWDETDEASKDLGVPWSLTAEKFRLDDRDIDNPLRSYRFPIDIRENANIEDGIYTKPKGYDTVRYPLSGLVGTDAARKASEEHNKKFDHHSAVIYLNQNVKGWLNKTITLPDIANRLKLGGVRDLYKRCLEAPNYTVFSNQTSSDQWNKDHNNQHVVVALETPHNDIHLSVGGFDVPALTNHDYSVVPGANGDMGENDTAALDPIFFFHHCNVDRMFWVWQKRNGFTEKFDITPKYPGTNSNDAQGPSAGEKPDEALTLDTPLEPFKNEATGKYYTSKECINIETQMGFTYSIGSLDENATVTGNAAAMPTKKLHVSNINRAPISGSFVLVAYANVDGEDHYIGHRSFLSRWAVKGCVNCMTHLEVQAFFDLGDLAAKIKDTTNYRVEITGREQIAGVLSTQAISQPYKLEVR